MYRGSYLLKYSELRQQAESRLAQGEATPDILETNDLGGLRHEVSVQQVELEMQHDELLRAHRELGELRMQAERGREQYYNLFMMAPVGLLVLDNKGIITKCNLVFARMTGQEAGSLVGRTLAEFVAQRDRMNFDILFKQEINNRVGNRIDFHLSDKKGKTTHVRLSLTLLESEGGNGQECLITLADAAHE